jgi:hypothetical protein
MTLHIRNITFNILKSIYPRLLLVGFYFPRFLSFLVSYRSAFTFFIPNAGSRKYANILLYYPHHEGA